MKRKIIFILISVLLMVGALVYTGITFYGVSQKNFTKAGYVLNADKTSGNKEETKSVKYYFSENTSYKNSYDNTVEFEDTNGEKVRIDDTSFVHYNDDSISLLKKGVILNVEDVNKEIPKYYNLFEGVALEAKDSFYYVDNLGKKLKFNSFLVKTSGEKYLLVSDNLKVKLGDNEVTIKEKYVEISFVEEGIIKIENQSSSFSSIAENAQIIIDEDYVLNLDNGYFYYKDERKINLKQVIIDSNDNIDIKPAEDEEPEVEIENDNEGSENDNSNNGGGFAGGMTGGSVGFEEEVVESELTPPTANVLDLSVSSTVIEGKIAITDNDSLITGSTVVTLVEISTGKTVFNKEYEEGTYNIDLVIDSLKPNNVYNLTTRVTYNKDNALYTMDIVQQLVVTDAIGITLKKDYYTTDTLAFIVDVAAESGIKSAKVSLYESSGTDPINSFAIEVPEELVGQATSYPVMFNMNLLEDESLIPDTKYVVKVEDIIYNTIKLNNIIEMSAKTLKRRPEIGTADYDINKKAGSFTLKLNKLVDLDGGIQSLSYEVYDANGLAPDADPFVGRKPVAVIDSAKATSVELMVDDINIKRNNKYVFRVVGVFYDNEKYIEYVASLTSSVMNMEGRKAPYLTWSPTDVGWEHISGKVTVNNAETIVQKNNSDYLLVTITNAAVGATSTFKATLDDNDSFLIDINYLIADSVYTVSVTGPVDFGDGNGVIDAYHIGSFMVKTENPQSIEVEVEQDFDTDSLFAATIKFKGSYDAGGHYSSAELQALTYYKVSLYENMQSSVPMYSVTINDTNKAIDQSDFAAADYVLKVNLETFTNESEFLRQYGSLTQYILKVEEAYDYTYDKYYNENGIKVNNITLINGNRDIIPDIRLPLPANPDNAVNVMRIKNQYADRYGLTKAENLKDDTFVGLEVEAILGNINYTVKSVTYSIYNAVYDSESKSQYSLGNKLGAVTSTDSENSFKIVIKAGEYGLTRGGIYFVTYTAQVAIDQNTEARYPEADSGIVLSSSVIMMPKQNNDVSLYVADSNFSNNTANLNVYYKLEDPDNTIYSNIDGKKLLYASLYTYDQEVNEVPVGTVWSGELSDTSEYLNLQISLPGVDNLADYFVKIYTKSSVYVGGEYTSNIHFEQLYEGAYSVPENLSYSVSYNGDRNAVTVETFNASTRSSLNLKFMYRIVLYRVTFTLNGTGEQQSVDVYQFTNSGFSIDLLSIKNAFEGINLTGQELSVDVIALYDGGSVGFDSTNASDRFVLKYTPKTSDFQYLAFDSSSSVVVSGQATKSNYTMNMSADKKITMIDYLNRSMVLFGPGSNGYLYNSQKVVSNKIESVAFDVSADGSKTFTIQEILGVDLLNEEGFTDYVQGIDEITIHPVIYGLDNERYVKLVLTPINSEAQTVVRVVRNADLSDQQYTITGLEPNTEYLLNFYACQTESGESCDVSSTILDLNKTEGNDSNAFKVRTLAGIGIVFNSDNSTSSEYPDNSPAVVWSLHRLSLSYGISVTSGYDGIKYKLFYKDVGMTEWSEFKYTLSNGSVCQNGVEDYCFVGIVNVGKQMEHSINYFQNSIFNFNGPDGRVFKFEVVPVLQNKELTVAKGTYYFTLPKVSPPVIKASSAYMNVTNADSKLQLIIQSKDPHNILYTQTDGNTSGKYYFKSFVDSLEEPFSTDVTGKYYTGSKSFILSKVNPNLSYVLTIEYSYDLNNDGLISGAAETSEYVYRTRPVNYSGLDFGEVTYSVNNDKFVLYFEGTNISDKIDAIEYIIVDNNVLGAEDLYYTGTAVLQSWGTNGKRLVLETALEHVGTYHIQVNFYYQGNEVGSTSINAMYNVG